MKTIIALCLLLSPPLTAQRPPEAHDSVLVIPKGAFPVLLVDTAVRNRLAEEWEPNNRYQHERGYCARYTVTVRYTWDGPIAVYELTSILRADESGTSPNSIARASCPDEPQMVFLHTHPPTTCTDDDDGKSCTIGGLYGSQCDPSPTDQKSLEQSGKPFGVIQCAATGLAPFWNRKG